jgi:oligoendopeptidase F
MKNKFNSKNAVWNLKSLFAGDSDPSMGQKRKEIEEAAESFEKKWRSRKDYLENPETLKQALDELENFQHYFGPFGAEYYYFWLRTSQDQSSPVLKAKFNKINDFSQKIQNKIRFFELNIARIPEQKQDEFLKSKNLKNYRHYLERTFVWSKYLLSEPEEKLLELKSTPAYLNWVKMTSGFLTKEEREVATKEGKKLKSFAEILSFLDDKNKKTRDSAAAAFNEILQKNADVAEAELNSILGNKNVDDEMRSMPRPDLSRHLSDDIESDVVDVLIESVAGRFEISRRYYALKAKLMGVKKLEYHERNVPYGKINLVHPLLQATKLISKVLSPLDKKFAEIFEKFLENGQIDVYPRKNKTSSEFCSYNLLSEPTFILLNFTNKLDDVLVFAHELGHGINDELMKEKQNALNFGTPLATAEVASTFMEDFILQEIIKDADEELKLALMMMKLNGDISTIFRQAACYRFEQELHQEFKKKGYLSKEEIGKVFQKHMVAYMGSAVLQSPGSENWWVYWSHIRTFFYVYSYASGKLISKSLQNSYRAEPAFMGKIKYFLSAGLSESPKNIFKNLGIDITQKEFWDKGIDEIEGSLKEITALAKKLGKL